MSAPGRPEQARESIVMTEREVCTGVVLSDHPVLTLADLCRACGVHADWLMELVEEGLLEPRGSDPARWRFTGVSLRRVRIVRHLQRDRGVHVPRPARDRERREE